MVVLEGCLLSCRAECTLYEAQGGEEATLVEFLSLSGCRASLICRFEAFAIPRLGTVG